MAIDYLSGLQKSKLNYRTLIDIFLASVIPKEFIFQEWAFILILF